MATHLITESNQVSKAWSINPGWLFAITFLSFRPPELASRRIWSQHDQAHFEADQSVASSTLVFEDGSDVCFLGGIISNLFWRPWPFDGDGGQLCQHSQKHQRHCHPCFYLMHTSCLWTSCQRSLFIQASWLPCSLYIVYIGIHCFCAWCTLKF